MKLNYLKVKQHWKLKLNYVKMKLNYLKVKLSIRN